MAKLTLIAGWLPALLLLPSAALAQTTTPTAQPAPAAAAPAAAPPAAAPPAPPAEAPKKDDDETKLIVGVDGHLVEEVAKGGHELGSGLEARVGWHKTHLFGLLFVRPELGGGWDRVVANNMGRVYGGARLGVQFIVAAYLYGHAGYGFNAPNSGFTYDVGLGVDLVLLGFLRPGVHFDYMEIVNNVQTIRGGAHVEVAF